jgi:hypothetical protein
MRVPFVGMVIGANQHADGGDPTAKSRLREARRYWKKMLACSLVTATVGLVLQLIYDKVCFLGSLLNLVGDRPGHRHIRRGAPACD